MAAVSSGVGGIRTDISDRGFVSMRVSARASLLPARVGNCSGVESESNGAERLPRATVVAIERVLLRVATGVSRRTRAVDCEAVAVSVVGVVVSWGLQVGSDSAHVGCSGCCVVSWVSVCCTSRESAGLELVGWGGVVLGGGAVWPV